MTKEEINRAIAEACGQKYHKPTDTEIKSGSYYQYEPDYCSDLNTMRTAESTLPLDKQNRLAYELRTLLGFHSHSYFDLVHASAIKRAEAFLRAIGKWREPATANPN